MRRIEISALLSAGSAAEKAGRPHEAKSCAVALIQALRDARAGRETEAGGIRSVDAAAMRWAISIIQACTESTPN